MSKNWFDDRLALCKTFLMKLDSYCFSDWYEEDCINEIEICETLNLWCLLN